MDHQRYQYHQIKEIIFLRTIYLHLNVILRIAFIHVLIRPNGPWTEWFWSVNPWLFDKLTDFFPMPIINVMAVLSLFDNPSWITFAPLGHSKWLLYRLFLANIWISTVESKNRNEGSVIKRRVLWSVTVRLHIT